MEELDVLWDVDGKLEWWSAELISTASSRPGARFQYGTIRYAPRRKYEAVDYDVKFFTSSKDIKRLQHINPASENPTQWKFSDEPLEPAASRIQPKTASNGRRVDARVDGGPSNTPVPSTLQQSTEPTVPADGVPQEPHHSNVSLEAKGGVPISGASAQRQDSSRTDLHGNT